MRWTSQISPEQLLLLFASLLLLPALLVNLGLLTFIEDEAIRSLVALEMKYSGNYVTPTIMGEYYYNKPPLYNWILLAFFNVTGTINEWTARMPTVLFLLAYGVTIFYFLRKHFASRVALLHVFVFLTCGRILFWDSFLGLIDICFSWITFMVFMVIFHAFREGRFYRLFFLAYLLTALGFLMKGLPSLVFLGITLLAWFIYQRHFRKLFSLAHLCGGLVFLALVGAYYWMYYRHNGLDQVFLTLFDESAKRTVVNYGWKNTVLHLFTFPFEMIYHFFPWSLMVIYLLTRRGWKHAWQHPLVAFLLLTFGANIIIYWSSPEVFPRYLLMLVPLLFSAFLFLHSWHEKEKSWQWKVLDISFALMIAVLGAASILPFFLPRLEGTPWLYPKAGFIALALAFLNYFQLRWPRQRLWILVCALLLTRLAFDWFVLPDRNANDWGDLCRQDAQHIGRAYQDQNLYIYKDDISAVSNAFYITKERREILKRKFRDFHKEELLIMHRHHFDSTRFQLVDSMRIRFEKMTPLIVQPK